MLNSIVLAAAAVVLGLVSALLWREFGPKTESWTPLTIGALSAAAILVFGVADHLTDTTTSAPRARPDSPGSAKPQTSPTESGTPEQHEDSTSPTPTTTPDTQQVMASSLVDLPAVTQDTNENIDLSTAASLTANGKTYGQALVYECSLYCDGNSPQVLVVTLGGQFNSFIADAVVLDTSEGVQRIDVTLDSRRPMTFIAKPGKTVAIDLDVTGVSRMRVQMYAPGELKSPVQAGVDTTIGENGGGLPGVALGDPLLVP